MGMPEPAWLAQEQPAPARRESLPPPAEEFKGLSLWSIVKDLVGKEDLLHMPLPVELHTPCTELQKQTEELEYSQLLDQAAAAAKGSLERHMLVGAWALSGYANCLRPLRSLDPAPGETFELVYPEKGWRTVTEYVSHVVPCITQHAEGRGWALDTESEPHAWFWGPSLDLNMHFFIEVTFHDGEKFSWTKAKTSVYGIMTGNLSVNHYGAMKVRSSETGNVAVLDLVKPSALSFSKAAYEARPAKGHLEDAKGRKLGRTFRGKWDGQVWGVGPEGQEQLLWTCDPVPPNNRWLMTRQLIHANELTPGLGARLPPSDSRHRADVRALEEGRYTEANKQKKAVDAAKHAELGRLKKAQKKEGPPPARFFELVNPKGAAGKELRWRYKPGSYWEQRAAGQWLATKEGPGQ